MSLSTLPNEIFAQISRLLSLDDRKSSMQVNREWHSRFQAFVLQCVYIHTTKQFKQFFYLLQKTGKSSQPLGLLIRRLTLGPRVGFVHAEFQMLPVYCPYLEYLDFNPRLWQFCKYTDTMERWRHLKRYPMLTRTRSAFPLLEHMGNSITHLELDAVIVDELANTHFSVISILTHTPNLKLLSLADGIATSQNISISEFEFIHSLCPRLEALYLDGFESSIEDSNIIDIETLPIATNLRNLRLNMSINSEYTLMYWSRKYALIEQLDIQLKLLEPEYYHEAVRPDGSRMKESFSMMATRFSNLKRIKARFDEKYFPCDVFLRGLNNTNNTQMQDVSIHFFNFDYHRRSAQNFKLLVSQSTLSLTRISISNWDRSWDFESGLLEPISQCYQLEELSLSPQPGTLTEFDIDVILDVCTSLKRLELANTYNLFVRDDTNDRIRISHPLESLSLHHTMVNNRLFDYLAGRCPHLQVLDISHVTKPYDNEIQVKIDMPNHRFQSISIDKLQLGLRIEDAGFQCNYYSALCSIEETSKAEDLELRRRANQRYPEKWYHLYQPKGWSTNKITLLKPRLQRLKEEDIEKIKSLEVTKQLWEQISFVGSRIKYEDKKKWYLDIPYGYFSVRCKSVDKFAFEGIPV